MTANASSNAPQPFVETAADAARFWQIGILWKLLASGHKTGGALCFLDEVVRRRGGRARHTRAPADEGFYLLDGTCTFYAGGQTITAGAGTFVAVPRYTEHAFVASAGARLINFYLPAGFEMIVAGLGVPALRDGPPKPGEFKLPPRALVEKLGADYGQIPILGTPFADPPLKENMLTKPLLGAKALPLVASADGASSLLEQWRPLVGVGGCFQYRQQLYFIRRIVPPWIECASACASLFRRGVLHARR